MFKQKQISSKLLYLILLCLIWEPIKIFSINFDHNLPEVVILGAQKSGTSAFHTLLSQHPQIINKTEEIHFFDLNFQEGVDWYKQQFPQEDLQKNIRVDKTAYYLFHPLVPQRMHELLPNAKLIVLLRNPIDRAYSHYWMNVRYGGEPLSFAEAVRAEPSRLCGEEEKIVKTGLPFPQSPYRHFSYLSRGIYVEQLIRWFNYYPPEQILIISFDDFAKDPDKIMQETLKFLGLSEYHSFDFQVGERYAYPTMEPEIRKELSDYFRSYNKQLESLLNRKFGWD